MLRTLTIILLLCAICANAGSAGRVVNVGIYANAPKIYFNGQGQADGILIDLLRTIGKAEGWELRFVACDWTRCLTSLTDGRLDLLPDVAWSEERKQVLDFHKVPALFSWSQVYRRTDVTINTMMDTSGKRIAILAGSIQQRFFSDYAGNFGVRPRLVPVMSVEDAFALVEGGKADAVVASNYAGALYASGYSLVETPVMFQPVRLYYPTRQGQNADLLGAIDRRLGAWQQDPGSPYFEVLDHLAHP